MAGEEASPGVLGAMGSSGVGSGGFESSLAEGWETTLSWLIRCDGLLEFDGGTLDARVGDCAGRSTESVLSDGDFECFLPQNEKKLPPCLMPLDASGTFSTGCFSTILQPTGITSSSTSSFRRFTAVSQVVDPLVAR